MDCKEGFIEFDADDNQNTSGVRLICSTGGTFQIEGSCRKFCSLDRFKDYGLVSEWQRCDSKATNCKNNGVTTANGDNLLFAYGEVAKVKSCVTDYILWDNNNGLAILCGGNGDWTRVGGHDCLRACKISDLELGGDSGWIGCSSNGTCSSSPPLSGTMFRFGDKISLSGQCRTGYSISSGIPMRFSCGEDGTWSSDDGERCWANCNIKTSDSGLEGEENTSKWGIYDKTAGEYVVLSTNTVKNGEKIRPYSCKTGYNVYVPESVTYLCNRGSFSFMGGTEYCKMGCKFAGLTNLVYQDVSYSTTTVVASWIACMVAEPGMGCVPIFTADSKDSYQYEVIETSRSSDMNKYAFLDSTYKINGCNSDFERPSEDNALIVKCSSGGQWVIENSPWNTCRIIPRCYEFGSERSSRKIDMTGMNLIDHVDLQLWGAPGGRACNNTGSRNYGGYTKGTLNLSSGKIFYLTVGGVGAGEGTCGPAAAMAGGFNGGGYGGSSTIIGTANGSGGGGGGATDIRLGGKTLDKRIAVAGGGGGNAGKSGAYSGGGGGGANGSDNSDSAYGSRGGTETAGGQLGTNRDYSRFVSQGVFGQGGHGAGFKDNVWYGAGGGGGGWYGGGGASTGTAGGGSGYVSSILSNTLTTTQGSGPDDGFARLCWGDWYGQTNPCSQNVHRNYTNSTNRTSCVAADSSFASDVVGTPKKCTRANLISILASNNSLAPGDANTKLPPDYYEEMKVYQPCSTGYSIEGGVNGMMEYKCTNSGVWVLSSGLCRANPCENNSPITHAPSGSSYNIVASAGQTKSEEDKTFSCTSGYTGNVVQSCSLGEWSYKSGACYKNCQDTEAVSNGSWVYSPTTKTHGAIATLGCNGGYALNSSNKTRTCNDGVWSSNSVACVRGCSGAPAKITGSFYYVPSGSNIRSANGTFYTNSSSGITTLPTIGNISSIFTEAGTVLDAGCSDGYTEYGTGGTCDSCGGSTWLHYYYCDGSTWKYSGKCEPSPCPIISLANGSWTYSDPTKRAHNSTARVSCSDGYILSSGPTTISCSYGKWTIDDVACTPSPCQSLSTTNGTWSYTNAQAHGSVATLSCNGGYAVNSSSKTRTCDKGFWSNNSVACVRGCNGAPSLEPNSSYSIVTGSTNIQNVSGTFYTNSSSGITTSPTRGNISSIFTVSGTTLRAGCEAGYTEDSAGGTCNGCGGSGWKHYYYCDGSTWKRSGTCSKSCGDLRTNNGTWTYHGSAPKTHGSIASFSCNSNYTTNGSPTTVTCNNGSWGNTDGVSCCEHGAMTLTSSGNVEVPKCAKTVLIEAWGGKGGGDNGGNGGYSYGTYSKTAEANYIMYVKIAYGGSKGDGCGTGRGTGGDGGKAALVSKSSNFTDTVGYRNSDLLLVAGGGGGRAELNADFGHPGGVGGGGNNSGGYSGHKTDCSAGNPGTTTGAGPAPPKGNAGSGFTGGTPPSYSKGRSFCGGAGGGGYYGGSSGESKEGKDECRSGGGGGSGFCKTGFLTGCGGSSGAHDGAAEVKISWK
jgi:hypothetical protein